MDRDSELSFRMGYEFDECPPIFIIVVNNAMLNRFGSNFPKLAANLQLTPIARCGVV